MNLQQDGLRYTFQLCDRQMIQCCAFSRASFAPCLWAALLVLPHRSPVLPIVAEVPGSHYLFADGQCLWKELLSLSIATRSLSIAVRAL
jgi:hypothetical protein